MKRSKSRSTTRRTNISEIDKLRGFFLQIGWKVTILEYLANLDQAVFRQGAALGPFYGLLLRLHLNDPEAGDDFLGFGEGAVGYDGLAAGHAEARAFGGGVEALGGEQHASFGHVLVELSHREDDVWAGNRELL